MAQHNLIKKLVTALFATVLPIILILIGVNGVAYAWPNLPSKLTFPSGITGEAILWNLTEIVAPVPAGVVDGNITVQTADGASNGSPFKVGSSFTPAESGEGTTWSSTFSGNIASNTTWNQNILITGDVTVPSGVTLTILPGTTVFFVSNSDDQASGFRTGQAEIIVHGTLTAEGTESNPIYFTSDASSKAPDQWGGIYIRRNSTTSTITHCVMHYAYYAIHLHSHNEAGGAISATIRNCTLASNLKGIRLSGRNRGPGFGADTLTIDPLIANNLIINNTQIGIEINTTSGRGTTVSNAVVRNNIISDNNFGIQVEGSSWWIGHNDNSAQIINNTIKDNVTYGLIVDGGGSSDSSGSDTDIRPTVENNLFDNNDVNIRVSLNPKGVDGVQVVRPTIRYNTIRNGNQGIQVEDIEPYDTITPTISDNVFYGFDSAGSYSLNNTTARPITAQQNYWGDTEAEWDAGAQASDVNGTVDASNHLTSASPPLLTRIESAMAQTGDQITLYGANFTLPPPILTLEKTVSPDTNVAYHGDVTYTLVLSNSSGVNATASLTDTLPVSTTFSHWINQNGASETGNQLTWNGTITAWQQITLTFVASHTGNDAETIINSAEFYHPEVSGTAQATFTVGTLFTQTNVTLEKTINPSTATLGDQVTYVLTVINYGPVTAYGVVLTDILPSTLINPTVTYSSLALTDTHAAQNYVWQVQDLPPSSQGVIIIKAQVDPNLAGDISLIVNEANLTTTTPETTTTDNLTQIDLPIKRYVFLPLITKK